MEIQGCWTRPGLLNKIGQNLSGFLRRSNVPLHVSELNPFVSMFGSMTVDDTIQGKHVMMHGSLRGFIYHVLKAALSQVSCIFAMTAIQSGKPGPVKPRTKNAANGKLSDCQEFLSVFPLIQNKIFSTFPGSGRDCQLWLCKTTMKNGSSCVMHGFNGWNI